MYEVTQIATSWRRAIVIRHVLLIHVHVYRNNLSNRTLQKFLKF